MPTSGNRFAQSPRQQGLPPEKPCSPGRFRSCPNPCGPQKNRGSRFRWRSGARSRESLPIRISRKMSVPAHGREGWPSPSSAIGLSGTGWTRRMAFCKSLRGGRQGPAARPAVRFSSCPQRWETNAAGSRNSPGKWCAPSKKWTDSPMSPRFLTMDRLPFLRILRNGWIADNPLPAERPFFSRRCVFA